MSQSMSQPQGNRNGVHGGDGATFEQCYTRLQEVVQKLSAGNLTLQEALAAFEEGVSLADKCQQMLDQAELRVKQVSARAARTGAEAIDRLEAAGLESTPAIDTLKIESLEQRVVIDTSAPPRNQAAPGQPAIGEDKYADDLDLGPLFDDED